MPQKTRGRFPAESSEEKSGFARPNFVELLRLTSTTCYLGSCPSHALGCGDPRVIPGPRTFEPADASDARAASIETRSPGRGLCSRGAVSPAGAGAQSSLQVDSGFARGLIMLFGEPFLNQTTGLVSLAPAQAYGSSLPDLRPQRSAWKGSPCFKTP